jgi:hypothetical protein
MLRGAGGIRTVTPVSRDRTVDIVNETVRPIATLRLATGDDMAEVWIMAKVVFILHPKSVN